MEHITNAQTPQMMPSVPTEVSNSAGEAKQSNGEAKNYYFETETKRLKSYYL
jgi:hypothetical protein